MKYISSSYPFNNLLPQLFNSLDWASVIRAIIMIIAGFILAHIAQTMVLRIYQLKGTGRYTRLIGKLTYYPILLLFIFSAFRTLGFDLQIFLGATGILTVAIGFASQTSASNLISGLFLIAERSFSVGDTINVNGTIGEVLAVDLLSVKLRQVDNTMVRIPNEVLIKTQLINNSRYPTRRFDCFLSVSTQANISLIRSILLALVNHEPLCMQNPLPFVEIKEITDTAVRLQFSVWATQQNYMAMKSHIQEKMLEAFKVNKIAVASPTTLIEFTPTHTSLPIHLVNTAIGKPTNVNVTSA